MRRFDQHPRAVLILIAAASATVHGALSLLVRSPFFTPDEWLYAQLSRSVLHGHPGDVTGGHISIWSTTSYVGPAITSPLWLIDNVSIAYHLSLLVGSIAFALAVFPAYALARKCGLTSNASLLVALFSQLVPAAVFTATLLAEPYAYPALLLAVLIAVDAIAKPNLRRIAGVLIASAALCLIGGMQFFVFPLAVAAAWVASAATLRSVITRALAAVVATLMVIGTVEAAGDGSVLTRIRDSVLYQHYPLGSTASWYGVNAFVLALATGWVIVPVALVGLWRMLRIREQPSRAFAWLTLSLILGVLAEAAIWGANGNGLYERFTFYAVPLLVIASLHELTHHCHERRTPYALLAYAAAAAAVLIPLTSYLLVNEGHSPTMLGLMHSRALRVVWPLVAATLAVTAAVLSPARRRLLLVLAAGALAAITGLGFGALLHYQTTPAPDVGASTDAALLVDPTQVDYATTAMRFLFWNPKVERLVVMGHGVEPGLPAELGGALTTSGIHAADHGPVAGPFVVGNDVSAWRKDRVLAGGTAAQLDRTPDLVVFGWQRGGGLLPYSELFASGASRSARRVTLRLTALRDHLRLIVTCTSGRMNARTIAIPRRRSVRLVVDVPPRGSQDCRLSVAPGAGIAFDERQPVARAELVLSTGGAAAT